MKKKFISLLAAAAMLCSALPQAFAESTDTVDTVDAVDVVDSDNSVIENEENFNPEKELEEKAERNEMDLCELTEELHADEPGVDYDDEDVMSVAEAGMTVSGTISLPVAASEDGRVGVYLYRLKKDGNKIINSYSSSSAYTIVNVAKGSKSVKYSLTAPEGSYTVAARSLDGNGKILNEMTYYSTDGTSYCIEGADVITAGEAVNITLPAAERSISGTITLTEPVSEDGYAYIYCEDSEYNFPAYQSIPVTKGQTELNYSIGVRKDIYELEVNVGGGYYSYYSVTGNAGDYNDICYLNTTDKSLNGIDFTYDNTGENGTTANVTVNFGKTLDTDKSYALRLDYGNRTSSYTTNVKAGESSFSRKITPDNNGKFLISVQDRTDFDIWYSDGVAYYYSKELGLTPDKNLATKLTPDEADGLIINFPESNILTGTVQRNGCKTGADLDLYVFAKIGTEAFFTAVTIDAAADSAPYSIDIPKRVDSSEVEVYTALRVSNRLINVYGESVYPDSIDAVDVNAPADGFKKVSGTVKFAAPAPAGGLLFDFRSYNRSGNSIYSLTMASYFVSEGETELNYTVDILDTNDNRSDNGDIQAEFSVSGIDKRFNISGWTLIFASDTYNFTLPYKSQTIAGKIKAPDSQQLPSAVSYRVYINYSMPDGGSDYDEIYGSIMKGEAESEYSLNVPAEATLMRLELNMESIGTSPVYNTYLYYNGSGISEDWADINIPMTNGLKNVDFELIKGKLVTGVISVPDDFEGKMYCWVYTDGGSNNDINITSGGEYPYVATTQYDTEETEIYLSFSSNYSCNYYTGDTYYNSNGSTYIRNNAENVELNGDITEGINFNLIKAKIISGTLSFADGAYIEGGQQNGWIYASADSFRNGVYMRCYDTQSIDYSISVPEDINEEFEIYVDMYSSSNISTNIVSGEYYYTEGGELSVDSSQAKKFTIDTIEDNINLVIPVGYCISGKIILPKNAVGSVESACICWTPVNGGGSSGRSMKIADDGSYKLFVAPREGGYKLSVEPYEMPAVTNIIGDEYYYLNDSQSTTNSKEASVINANGDVDNIDIFLECGKMISGKITVPDDVNINSNTGVEISVDGNSLYTNRAIRLSGKETEFGIAVPLDYEGDIAIDYCCNRFYDNSVYRDTLYVGETGPVLNSKNAKKFTVGDAGVSGINIPVVKNLVVINLTAYRPSYAGRDYSIYPSVYVVLDNGEVFYGGMGIYYDDKSASNIVSIPDLAEYRDVDEFKVYYDIYENGNYDNLSYDYSEMYINSDGTFTFDKDAAESFKLNSSPKITFTVWDNSALVRNALKEGSISTAVTEAYLNTENSAAHVKLNLENDTNTAYNAAIIVCEYDSNGAFVKLYQKMYSITRYENELELDIPVDIASGHTYKLFSWDNVSFMTPMAASMQLQAQ